MPQLRFRGLNNRADPVMVKPGTLTAALNVDLDNQSALSVRGGFSLFLSGASLCAAYATQDGSRLFVVDSGSLLELFSDGSSAVLAAGFVDGNYYWCEAGEMVFVSGPVKAVIRGQVVRSWGIPVPAQPQVKVYDGSLPAGRYLIASCLTAADGRRGGISTPVEVALEANGRLQLTLPQVGGYQTSVFVSSTNGSDLYYLDTTSQSALSWDGPLSLLTSPVDEAQVGAFPPPDAARVVEFHDGRVWLAEYLPDRAATVLWRSSQFWPDLFRLADDYDMVAGEVRMLQSTANGLLVGTDSRIILYGDQGITTLVSGGVQFGAKQHLSHTGERALWALDGMYSGDDLEPKTSSDVEPDKGKACSSVIIETGTADRMLVSVKRGGRTENPYG